MKELINRPQYIEQLIQNKDVDLVKIVTGIRRCGKSSILDLYHQYLSENGVDESHIIHMNLESLRFRDITDHIKFYDYVAEQIQPDGKTYLIFDELQNVPSWEKAIESFRLDYDVDIYITGSNAYLLSTEFSTLLSGRYVEIKVLPLSFKEFLTFYDFDTSVTMEEKFQKYLQFGGMPILREYKFNEARVDQALEGIYSTVVLKDILQRNSQADNTTLQKIMRFMCSNIGSITSPNNIGVILSNEGDIREGKSKGIAGKTVNKYISMLCSAYIFSSVGRYDVKGKQLLKTLEKNYIIDLGFRNMLLGFRDADRGHLIENIVYLELIRRDWRVYIGKVGETEVDFVAEKPGDKLYIQVTESIQSPETRERELRPLQMIRDNYEKKTTTTATKAKKTVDELAKEVIAGKWSAGDERKHKLTTAGYDYSKVQARVNELMAKPTLKSVDEIAKEVIQGKWGNGDERKQKLTSAGYDYGKVQARVNELMKNQ